MYEFFGNKRAMNVYLKAVFNHYLQRIMNGEPLHLMDTSTGPRLTEYEFAYCYEYDRLRNDVYLYRHNRLSRNNIDKSVYNSVVLEEKILVYMKKLSCFCSLPFNRVAPYMGYDDTTCLVLNYDPRVEYVQNLKFHDFDFDYNTGSLSVKYNKKFWRVVDELSRTGRCYI